MRCCCLVGGVSLVWLKEGKGRRRITFIVFGGWLVDNGTMFQTT